MKAQQKVASREQKKLQARARRLAATSNKQLILQTYTPTNYRELIRQVNCLLRLPPRPAFVDQPSAVTRFVLESVEYRLSVRPYIPSTRLTVYH